MSYITHQDSINAIVNAFDTKFHTEMLEIVNNSCDVIYICAVCCSGVEYKDFPSLMKHFFEKHDENLVITEDKDYLERNYIFRTYSCTKCFVRNDDIKSALLHYLSHLP